jgi:hypothetical protein
VVSGLFDVSSPQSPEVALRRAEKTEFEKFSEGVRSRSDIRFIQFAVTEFGTLGGHATALLKELAKHAAASKKRMHMGKLLVFWRRKVSLAVHLLTRTTSCAVCPPPQPVRRPLRPRLGWLHLPRRSLPAPWAASVPVLL